MELERERESRSHRSAHRPSAIIQLSTRRQALRMHRFCCSRMFHPLAQKADPIDALAVPTHPRAILPCPPLRVVDLVQEGAKGPIENPPVIVIWLEKPTTHLLVCRPRYSNSFSARP